MSTPGDNELDNGFEAVPCMLRNPDGASSVYGLLIRPKNQPQPTIGTPHTKTTLTRKDRAILPRSLGVDVRWNPVRLGA